MFVVFLHPGGEQIHIAAIWCLPIRRRKKSYTLNSKSTGWHVLVPPALKLSKEKNKLIVQILLLGREVDGCRGQGYSGSEGDFLDSNHWKLPKLEYYKKPNNLLERGFNGPHYTYCSCSESAQHSEHPASYGAAWQRKYLLEVLLQKSVISWKQNTSSESSFVHKGFKLAFQEPTIVFEEHREPAGCNKALLMGSGSWTKASLDEKFCSDFSKYQIRFTGFRCQFLTAGQEWGECSCKPLFKEYNHLEGGRKRLFLLCFSERGTGNTESTKIFSPGRSANAAQRISPVLALDVLLQTLLGSHRSQVCLGSHLLTTTAYTVTTFSLWHG